MTADATFDLKSLGFTEAELQVRVVDKIVEALLFETHSDEDGRQARLSSRFDKTTRAAIMAKIDESITNLADKIVLPQITGQLESLCLQPTNEWGEKNGEPLTFIKYITDRANSYMSEPVDFNGNPKKNSDYSWKPAGTRLVYLMEKHLHYHISRAVEGMFREANAQIAGGIQAAIKISLQNVLAGIEIKTAVR